MTILSLLKQLQKWFNRQYILSGRTDSYSSCFSGRMDIAVPPLEVEFMHYELVHELGEFCKSPTIEARSLKSYATIEKG